MKDEKDMSSSCPILVDLDAEKWLFKNLTFHDWPSESKELEESKVVILILQPLKSMTFGEMLIHLEEMAKHNLRPLTVDEAKAFQARYEREESDKRDSLNRFAFVVPKD